MPKPELARTLRFTSLDDILIEANRIAADPEAVVRGQWTAAQNIWHVGRVIQASVEGFPAGVPFLFKLIGPLLKTRVTTKPFNPGIKMPSGLAAHFVAPIDTTCEEAISLLQSSIDKAKAQGFIPASPLFGKLSTEQWTGLHCRHAEMHFGLIELEN